jgi:hypothetical protein
MPISFEAPPQGRPQSYLTDEQWEDIRQAKLRKFSWVQIFEAAGGKFRSVSAMKNSYYNHFRDSAHHTQVRPRELCTLAIEGQLAGSAAKPPRQLAVKQAGNAPAAPRRRSARG